MGALAFVTFGWTKTKNLGAAMPAYCPHCDNDVWLSLIKQRRWVTLFFWLPVLPLGRADHYLECSTCGATAELRGDESATVIACVRATEALEAGQITEHEYKRRLDDALGAEPPEVRWQPGDEDRPLDAAFCYECGAELPSAATECPACGWAGAIGADVSPPPVELEE